MCCVWWVCVVNVCVVSVVCVCLWCGYVCGVSVFVFVFV